MEELLAYAVLLGEGFEIGERYERRLDELFLASPEDRDLLELELLSGNWKASGIYIRSHVDYSALDRRRFGGALMEVLKPVYESMEAQEFASRAFQVWEGLPGNLQGEDPFWALWGITPGRGRRGGTCGGCTGGCCTITTPASLCRRCSALSGAGRRRRAGGRCRRWAGSP